MPIINLDGVTIHVTRKKVKNINLRVYPPDGAVRVSAPRRLPEAQLRAFLTQKLPWIRAKQALIAGRARPAAPVYESGSTHDVFGRPCRLMIVAGGGRARVQLVGDELRLTVPPNADREMRAILLQEWYRAELKARIPPLLAHWQPIVGRTAAAWGVRKMRTRWGSCNIQARRIWLSLELAKRPPECLEYVLVHELVHLHERYHNARFWGLLDQFMPDWRLARERLQPGGRPAEID